MEREIQSVLTRIVGISPVLVILFGSGAEGKVTDQSDLDFLVVMETEPDIRKAQKSLYTLMPLSRFPVDIVWVTRDRFDRMKQLGGVCMIAAEEGRRLFEREALQ